MVSMATGALTARRDDTGARVNVLEGAPVLVRDALVPDPRVLDARASVQEVASVLVRPGVSSVLVVDGDLLAGVITAADVLQALADGRYSAGLAAGDLASADVESVVPNVPLDEAIHLLADRDLERLAVVEGGRLLGVLPREGLVRRLAEDEPPVEAEDA
jgi:CBS domain-containing protein